MSGNNVEEVSEWIEEMLPLIAGGATLVAADDFDIITSEDGQAAGITNVVVMVMTPELNMKFKEFVEQEFKDDEDIIVCDGSPLD